MATDTNSDSNSDRWVVVSFKIPVEYNEILEQLVEQGVYPSKSEAIRTALRGHLKLLAFAIKVRVHAEREAKKSSKFGRAFGGVWAVLTSAVNLAASTGFADMIMDLSAHIGNVISRRNNASELGAIAEKIDSTVGAIPFPVDEEDTEK